MKQPLSPLPRGGGLCVDSVYNSSEKRNNEGDERRLSRSLIFSFFLLMVIRFAIEDGHSTIDLLDEK